MLCFGLILFSSQVCLIAGTAVVNTFLDGIVATKNKITFLKECIHSGNEATSNLIKVIY